MRHRFRALVTAPPGPRAVPPWLAHAVRWQRGPVPWPAVLRGALGAAPPLLVAVVLGAPTAGVPAALGAMFGGLTDRPGRRRRAATRIGVPALAGALGLLLGGWAAPLGAAPALPLLPVLLAALGLLAGGVSAIGPVGSACGTQLLVTAVVGAGMPLPEPAWLRAVCFLAGAAWLLLLRLATPGQGTWWRSRALSRTRRDRFAAERACVAGVYRAVADLLRAAGGPRAEDRRLALTAALDRAQDALSAPWPRRATPAELRLRARFDAALPLAEAATALAWQGAVLPARAAEGPARLAVAADAGTACGPLPAPSRADAGLRALDAALLHAAESFDRNGHQGGAHAADAGTTVLARRADLRGALRRALGPAGREYGVRVALGLGVSAAVAQGLHHPHGYWLPATAVFLIKPDLGPLASRVLCRALGTLLGAVLCAVLAPLAPAPYGPVAAVVVCGALIPLAARHFAAQTAVITVLVLALMSACGQPSAAGSRLVETLLACAIVLFVGHLPLPGRHGGGVRERLAAARRATDAYVAHVLGGSDDRAARWALRRAAYRALAEARAAGTLAAAELPPLARHTAGTGRTAALLERVVDATTACAVHLDDTGVVPDAHAEQVAALAVQLAAQRTPVRAA